MKTTPAPKVSDDQLLDGLLNAVSGPAMTETKRNALHLRLLARCEPNGQLRADHQVMRAAEGTFVPCAPGVDIKVLFVDLTQQMQSSILRMAPGSTLPAHRHAEAEECMVMLGSVVWRGDRYAAGDYLRVESGIVHEAMTSDEGALVFIRGEILNSYVIPPKT